MHPIFCAHLIIFWECCIKTSYVYTIFGVLPLCNLSVICNLNRFHSFIYKLCKLNVYILKICTGDVGLERNLVVDPIRLLYGWNRSITYQITESQHREFLSTPHRPHFFKNEKKSENTKRLTAKHNKSSFDIFDDNCFSQVYPIFVTQSLFILVFYHTRWTKQEN